MSRLAQTIRFLVGLAMVVGGATLAAPLATRLAATVATARARQMEAPAGPQVPVGAPGVMPPVATAIGADATAATAAISSVPSPVPPSTPSFEPVPTATGPAFEPRTDYQPPPPPDPLPPLPTEFARPQPRLGSAYRSTLDVPPPPLLDAGAPPPLAAGWPRHDVARPIAVPAARPPATYRVRDGDDLAGIASRFYGHPAAAAGIWSANRHTIGDPNILPIGVELVLPPPWDLGIGAASRVGGPAIEPASAALPVGPAAAGSTGSVAAAPAWLTATGAAGDGPVGATSAGRTRAASVRVGPGETLATLATRFYGDAAMAGRIFEANRDRLRSPDLVVPGMELRLP